MKSTKRTPAQTAGEYISMLLRMKRDYEDYKLDYTAFGDYGKKDRKETITKFLKKDCDQIVGMTARKKFDNSLDSTIENVCKKRRINAIAQYVIDNIDIDSENAAYAEYVFCKANMSTPISVPTKKGDYNVIFAIAIYILDAIKMSGNLDEAMLYIPEEYDETIKDFYDFKMRDSCYNADIIFSVVDLIMNRYDTKSNVFLNDITVTLTQNNVTDGEYKKSILPKLDNEEYKAACDKIISESADISKKDRLYKLLSFIHPEIISIATNRFKKKVDEIGQTLVTIYAEYVSDVLSTRESLLKRVDDAIEKAREIQKLYKEEIQQGGQRKNNCLSNQNINAPYGIANGIVYHHAMDTLIPVGIRKMQNAIDELVDMVDEINEMNHKICSIVDIMEDILRHMRFNEIDNILNDSSIKESIKTSVTSLTIENPYETCFAYLMLIETGDDTPWFVDIPRMILCMAEAKLPWRGKVTTELYEAYSTSRENKSTDNKDKFVDNIDEEARLYDMCYTDEVLWYLFNKKQPPATALSKNNFAQLIYKLTGIIMPRKCAVAPDESFALKKAFSKKNIDMIKAYMIFCQAQHDKEEFVPTPPDAFGEKDTDTDADAQNKDDIIREQKTEIERLNNLLRDMKKQLQTEQGTVEKLNEKHKIEKQELNELRELIYKLQNQTAYEEEITEQQISFPYETKKRIVIFGGHETWLKAISPMLKNVRFIDPYTKVDSNLVRYADEVWMQTNAMSHSYYNNIVAVARQQKIPMKYFAYASAEKCATQLALHDITEGETE